MHMEAAECYKKEGPIQQLIMVKMSRHKQSIFIHLRYTEICLNKTCCVYI